MYAMPPKVKRGMVYQEFLSFAAMVSCADFNSSGLSLDDGVAKKQENLLGSESQFIVTVACDFGPHVLRVEHDDGPALGG